MMRQLVTVKFSFNSSLPRNGKEASKVKDHNGNYDVLPLISADALQVPALKDKNGSETSEDRQTMIEGEMELNSDKEDQFEILYQKYEQKSTRHPMLGTMIVHKFITVAELSPNKGSTWKLCQICHTPLRRNSTIKCVHCDFKCHDHCQVSTNLIVEDCES